MNILLLIFSLNPNPIEIVDRVDRIELNHMFDGKVGEYVFDQLIFYFFTKEEEAVGYKPISWILVKEEINIIPSKKGYSIRFYDKKRILRKIESKVFIETWTPFDSEIIEAEHWKVDRNSYNLTQRRKL
jgi:hypothetical protein